MIDSDLLPASDLMASPRRSLTPGRPGLARGPACLTLSALLLATLVGLFSSTPLLHAAATDPLSLPDALHMAQERLEDVALIELSLERVDELNRQALATLLPRAAVQVQYLHNSWEIQTSTTSVPKDNVTGSATVSVAVVNAPALVALKSVRESERAARASLERSRQLLEFQVARSFYAALSAGEQLEAREKALTTAEQALKVAQDRQTAGVGLQSAVARAQLLVARARSGLEQARLAKTRSYAALEYLIGTRPERLAAPPETSLPALQLEQALTERPDVQAVRASARASQLAADQSWADWLPTVTATGTLRASPNGYGTTGGGVGEDLTWQAGLRLDWTLYDGGLRESNMRVKKIAAEEATLRQSQLERQVKLELEQLVLEEAGAVSGLAAAEAEKIAAADNYAQVEAQWRAGRSTSLEVSDAASALADAESRVVVAKLGLALTRLEARRVMGRPVAEGTASKAP